MLAPAGQLREGNALLNIAFTVGAAGGPAIAGLVVAGAGVETALLADAISFLAVAGLLVVARRLRLPEPDEPEARWTERLRRGLAYVRERPALRRLLGAQAAGLRLLRARDPDRGRVREGDARRRRRRLRRPARQLGRRDGRRQPRCSPPCGGSRCGAAARSRPLAIGVAYLGDRRSSPTLLVACAASFVGGLGNGVQWIALVTAVQELTRAAYQARVLSLLEALASAMPGIGFLLGGAIAAIFEPRVSYAVAGAGVLAVLAVAAVAPAPGRVGPRARAGAAQDGLQDGASSVAAAGSSRTAAYTALTVR